MKNYEELLKEMNKNNYEVTKEKDKITFKKHNSELVYLEDFVEKVIDKIGMEEFVEFLNDNIKLPKEIGKTFSRSMG